MTPQNLWKLVKLVPFALAIALVGCGDDGSSSPGTTIVPTPTPDTVPPSVPTNLDVEWDNGTLVLQWDENSEPDLAGYMLQRSYDAGTTWEYVSPTPLTVASYVDTFANRADYRVSAIDTSDNQSAYSNRAIWIVTVGGGRKHPALPDNPDF
jgi:hypothetical protein